MEFFLLVFACGLMQDCVRFPKTMRAFANEVAAPGTIWVMLELGGGDGKAAEDLVAFARLGDRFLWIQDPWTVTMNDEGS